MIQTHSPPQRRQSGLKSGGSWIQVKEISIFPGKFSKNFDFSRQILKKIRLFQANFRKNRFFQANFKKNLIFSSKFSKKFYLFRQFLEKIRFSRQKLLIHNCFWTNYSISLQKSPLSKILPVHDKI